MMTSRTCRVLTQHGEHVAKLASMLTGMWWRRDLLMRVMCGMEVWLAIVTLPVLPN